MTAPSQRNIMKPVASKAAGFLALRLLQFRKRPFGAGKHPQNQFTERPFVPAMLPGCSGKPVNQQQAISIT